MTIEHHALVSVPIKAPASEAMCHIACGCPQEEWDYRGALIALHQDEGECVQISVYLDEGDGVELESGALSLIEARDEACRWVDAQLRAAVH